MTLTLPPAPGRLEIRNSVPVTAAVTAPAWTLPPPAPLGEENKIVPLSRMTSRPPGRNRKRAFEPTRVIVKSGNFNSARESPPVLRAVLPRTMSPSAARRGGPFSPKSETIFTVRVTSASSKGSAHKAGWSAMNEKSRTRIRQVKLKANIQRESSPGIYYNIVEERIS